MLTCSRHAENETQNRQSKKIKTLSLFIIPCLLVGCFIELLQYVYKIMGLLKSIH